MNMRPNEASSLTPQTIDRLVANRGRFLAFLERRLGSRELAEEILQDAYLRGIERGGELRDEESARAWFFRILRNAIVDRHRRRAVERRALESLSNEVAAEAPSEEWMDAICECIGGALETLKDEYADVLRTIELEAGSMRDYAEARRITPGNAAVRLHRARKALRARLVETCGTCSAHGCLECGCAAKRSADPSGCPTPVPPGHV